MASCGIEANDPERRRQWVKQFNIMDPSSKRYTPISATNPTVFPLYLKMLKFKKNKKKVAVEAVKMTLKQAH